MDQMIAFPPCLSPRDPAETRALVRGVVAARADAGDALDGLAAVLGRLARLGVSDLVAVAGEPGGAAEMMELITTVSGLAEEFSTMTKHCGAALDRAGFAAMLRADRAGVGAWLDEQGLEA